MMIDRKKIQINLIGGPTLPKCPSMLKTVAIHILEMLQEDGYFDYQKMAEADKWLIARYWRMYDGLTSFPDQNSFEEWIKAQATNPELITRARRWLVHEGFLKMKEGVLDEAKMSEDRWSRAISGR